MISGGASLIYYILKLYFILELLKKSPVLGQDLIQLKYLHLKK